MTRDEIITAWNAQADFMNTWHYLGEDEKIELAMKLEREACAKVCDAFESDADPDAGAVLAKAIRSRGQAPAQPAVPDAIRHTDLSENIEYIRGWNECRELTIQMQITSPTKQGGAA
jgi:hypothetical protein